MPYLANPAWTCAFTAASKVVPVTGANPLLLGVLAGDEVLDGGGVPRALEAVGAGSVTLVMPAPANAAGVAFVVRKSSPLRSSAVAQSQATRDVYNRMQQALRDGRRLVVLGRQAAPPSTPADGDAYLVIATATGAWAGKESSIAIWDAAAAGWTFTPPVAGMAVSIAGTIARLQYTGTVWSGHFSGAGSPEGVIAAPVGATYSRTDGGATTTLYVKTSGTGATGWTAK